MCPVVSMRPSGCVYPAPLKLLMRSVGVPFNVASFALLTMMVAQVCKLRSGEFVHTLGDAHLYLNHLEQADLQLTRTPRVLPRMEINPAVRSIFDFKYEDFILSGYDPHPHIKAEVAV